MDNVPVADLAGRWLEELRSGMDPDRFSESNARGKARSFDLAIRELIEPSPAH